MTLRSGVKRSLATRLVGTIALGLLFGASAPAQQQAPAIGYMYPSGGQAGTTVDVVLGGYDWTPDIELFVHDPRIGLEFTGSPGPVIVPEPPYWFEKKARRGPFPLPRETPAKLTIPADVKPGVYRWQAANANGATATGRLMVSAHREVREQAERTEPQMLDSLPVIVCGQIIKIEEVDRFRFVAPHDGPITLSLEAAAIGSPLTAGVEVRNASGQLVAEATDTAGDDLRVTFAAKLDQPYVVSIFDIDFRGNRSFVYRMAFTPGPQVVATIPAAGRRGETRDVEFVGYGVATGGAKLESLTRSVTFPDGPADSFAMRLETPFGVSEPVALLLSDIPEVVEAARRGDEAIPLSIPSAVTGVLDQRYGADRYVVEGKQGETWAIELRAEAVGSKLDVALSVLDGQGKELKRSDDLTGTTDAGLEFVVPADGSYEFIVSDSSLQSGNRAAVYRLAVRPAELGFTLSGPEFVTLPLGGKASLAITATRAAGFAEPIRLRIEGLPVSVSIPDETVIAAGQSDVKIELSTAAEAGTVAAKLQVAGQARIGERDVVKRLEPVLLAVTMNPPFSVDAEGKDDVTKWPRGTTFPGPVLIQRDEGFAGNIVLEMAARQGRHRQGIRGPELTVPPDVDRILYPVFLPEWLETTRTSRMVVNGVAQVADPKGRVRYLSSKLKTRIGFLPTGALLKIDCEVPEIEAASNQPFDIPLTINRAKNLFEPAHIELVDDRESQGLHAAEGLTVAGSQSHAVLSVTPLLATGFVGERKITIRATVLQNEQYPVVSETQVLVVFGGVTVAGR
ncbi:MAG: hypothetical protein O3C40_02865 [Planctomycetota bacterium]|nr:hypothetical protein [Planctomycetota bacterium]